MSRKRVRTSKNSANHPRSSRRVLPALPNEILLEIWHQLPPLERVCVSQVCRKWRSMALAVPSLWTHVAVVDEEGHGHNCVCPPRPPQNTREIMSNVYYPWKRAHNAGFLRQLLARSRDLPLQVTILARGCLRHYGNSFSYAFNDHRQRIVRVHLEYSSETQFLDFLKYCNFDLPAVRTLSAGFDDREIHYDDIPVRSANPKCLPVLSQVVFGASACIPWCCIPLPGVQELTLTPDNVRCVSHALTSCTNLSRLTILMAQFDPPSAQQAANPDVQRFLDDVARVPQLCFGQIAAAHETFLLTAFNDARFRHLTLDYCGRVRRRSSGRYLSLPSPCDALSAPVRVTLTLRDGVYGITVFDVEERRRDIYMDESTIHLAPGLWEFYLRQQTVSSATVDANAWHYFAVGLPTECAIPELTVVVLQRATELQCVTLERFSSLHTLRINVVAHGLKLSSASVRSLVRSRANCDGGEALLSVLSLSPNAAYDASIAIFMSDFCDIIDH